MRRAAVFLWSTPLATAVSIRCWARRSASAACAESPDSATRSAFFDRVFNSDRIALLRNWRFSFCRLRLICDLMLAIGGLAFGGLQALSVGIRVAGTRLGAEHDISSAGVWALRRLPSPG